MATLKSVLMAKKRKPMKPLPPPEGGSNPFDDAVWRNQWPLPPQWARDLRWYAPYGPRQPQWAPYDPNKPAFMHPFNGPAFGSAGWAFGSDAQPGIYGDVNVGKDKAPLTGGWVYGLHNFAPDMFTPGNPKRVNPYDFSRNVGRA